MIKLEFLRNGKEGDVFLVLWHGQIIGTVEKTTNGYIPNGCKKSRSKKEAIEFIAEHHVNRCKRELEKYTRILNDVKAQELQNDD